MNAHWSHATAETRPGMPPTEGQRRSCGNGRAPWQYFVLRTTTTSGAEVDSLLVTAEMTLHACKAGESMTGWPKSALRNMAGDAPFAWLKPGGGEWTLHSMAQLTEPAPMPDGAMQIRHAKRTA